MSASPGVSSPSRICASRRPAVLKTCAVWAADSLVTMHASFVVSVVVSVVDEAIDGGARLLLDFLLADGVHNARDGAQVCVAHFGVSRQVSRQIFGELHKIS